MENSVLAIKIKGARTVAGRGEACLLCAPDLSYERGGLEKAIIVHKVTRWLCSAGYVQIFTPGMTPQRSSVSSVGHPYPYPELL